MVVALQCMYLRYKYRVMPKKNLAKFREESSVLAVWLCIGYLSQWAEVRKENSNFARPCTHSQRKATPTLFNLHSLSLPLHPNFTAIPSKRTVTMGNKKGLISALFSLRNPWIPLSFDEQIFFQLFASALGCQNDFASPLTSK